ncbi:MAG: helix-turn-helix transcriptional regulator [Acidimicrobiales bacterium]
MRRSLEPAASDDELRSIVHQTTDRPMASICLPSFALCTANDAAWALFARHGVELADGYPIADICTADEWRHSQPAFERRLAARTPLWRATKTLDLASGEQVCLDFTWIPVSDPRGISGHLLCYIDECPEPVAQRTPHTNALSTMGHDLEAVVGHINAARMLVFDPVGQLVHIGDLVAELFEDPFQAIGHHETELQWPQPEGAAFVRALELARSALETTDLLLRTSVAVYHAHVVGYSPDDSPPAALTLVLLLPLTADTTEVLLGEDTGGTRVLRARLDYLQQRLQAITEETQRASWLLGEDDTTATRETPLQGLERLSPREREVYSLIADGYRVPTIAKRLYVNQSTVRNHLSNVFRKLGVESQAELLELIREHRKTTDPQGD